MVPLGKPIIALKEVYKSFGKQPVLRGVKLEIVRGQTTVVIGPSGCGKTVLLKHIIGLVRPDRGMVFFDGHAINDMSEKDMVALRMRFGFLFQQGALFDSMTAGANVAFPLKEHTRQRKRQIQEAVEEKLAMVGLAGVEEKRPAELSGGMKKRVGLARAISLNPEVILYDEPTTGLDPITADVINELILKLQTELSVTSVAVTHDMASAYKIADRIVMLHGGRIVADGTPDQIRGSKESVVQRFINGQADEEDLAAVRRVRGLGNNRTST